jgi:predicted acyl esterase
MTHQNRRPCGAAGRAGRLARLLGVLGALLLIAAPAGAARLFSFLSPNKPPSQVALEALGREQIQIPYIALPPLSSPLADYAGFHPGQTLLHKGYTFEPGRMPFATDTVYERDVAIRLRDGTVIYADIYRPTGPARVPVILSYGPAGKRGQNNLLDSIGKDGSVPLRLGLPLNATSGLQAWESPDPAHWVPYGYALVNVDPRGVYMSGGNLQYLGPQDAMDGYDVIEYLARQSWCNGKVGMNGNGAYAMSQWTIAAERPPHLAAIAPWEGATNLYRDAYVRGGIPIDTRTLSAPSFGNGQIEDIATLIHRYPLMNAYWDSKIPQLKNIRIPAYIVASYSSQLDTRGTLEAFNQIGSREKWLRIHNTQAWPDLYSEFNRADLRRFFDRYLKGIQNDWPKTAPVRLAILDPGGTDVVNRAEKEFPLARQELRRLYLDAASGTLATKRPSAESRTFYVADDGTGKSVFTIRFDKDTEITGFLKLHLWVAAEAATDMDLYARVIKLDASGAPLFQDSLTYRYSGPDGRLRVSQRQLDTGTSSEERPNHTHRLSEPLAPGQIVPIELPLWPTGMVFHAGQQLQLVIAGYDYMLSRPADRPVTTSLNKGVHVIHTGGRYDSYLLVPVIPPRL